MMFNDDENQEKESVIDKIYRLEADYEKRASSIDGINKLETIKAFHDWYDATLRYLGQFFDQKNAIFKKISTHSVLPTSPTHIVRSSISEFW